MPHYQFLASYDEIKPLCFRAQSYQKPHPQKVREGHRDADATVLSPLLLGVADGVSQVEEFGIDASQLPTELLQHCRDLGMVQLMPRTSCPYKGPVSLLREAFEATQSLGSTAVMLLALDNTTKVHGKMQPMLATVSIGVCELLVLRRVNGRSNPLETVFSNLLSSANHEMQLVRVDERVDPKFSEDLTIEVIERGSTVHCVPAVEGDLVIMGTDGVFDNLFHDEVKDICNWVLPCGMPIPTPELALTQLARCLVEASHRKSMHLPSGELPETPVGHGGKIDDTSVVVGEVVEWTGYHAKICTQPPPRPWWQWQSWLPACSSSYVFEEEETCDTDSEE